MNFRKLALLAAAVALPACEEDVNDDSAAPAVTRRISVAADGREGDRASSNPDLTPDGRYAVFETAAALVAEDTNGKIDIYRKDLATGAITLVSVNDLGEPGDGDSTRPSISADGARVAFESLAANLSNGSDPDSGPDVYLRDLDARTTTHVSQAEGGGPATSTFGSFSAAISADGRYIVFASDADDIVSVPPNTGTIQVFRYPVAGGNAEMVSVTESGDPGAGESEFPAVSADGRIVAFESRAEDLVAGDGNGFADIFVRDMDLGETERVGGNERGEDARVSADGRYVVFSSQASDLVPDDSNGLADVFRYHRESGATIRVSKSLSGGGATGESTVPAVSADGRFVAYVSKATNLVPGDTNGVADHFITDVATGTTRRLSVRTGGAQGFGASDRRPALTADGRFAAFASEAPELVVGDSNGAFDVFLRGPNY